MKPYSCHTTFTACQNVMNGGLETAEETRAREKEQSLRCALGRLPDVKNLLL